LRIAPEAKVIVQAVAADESHTVELYRRGVAGIVSRPSRRSAGSLACARLPPVKLDRQSIDQLGDEA